MSAEPAAERPGAPLPQSFWDYLRSFGPGLIVVLTWLGAGDVVEAGTSGGNYGYALMWAVVLAVVMRFLFVSLIAKYQLCNQHREGVLDGLARLHPWYAPFLVAVAVVMGHIYGSYMASGVGECMRGLVGWGPVWMWAVFWSAVALAIVFRPVYGRVELVFKVLLALLSVSVLGTALWVGPDPRGIVEGTLAFKLPEQQGPFNAMLIAMGLIGAVGGSIMNLVYPYFLEQKGWTGPRYRRVQMYDFLVAVIVMIVLDLALWTLGAEVVHPSDQQVENLDDLALLLSDTLGAGGRVLFLLGVFAAVFTSLVGHALGLGCLASHGLLRWREGKGQFDVDYRSQMSYRVVAVWVLVSPLVWTLPGMPDFVTLTLIANSFQVIFVPVIALGLWLITAQSRYIGAEYRNRWWENLVMLVVLAVAVWAMYNSIGAVAEQVREMLA